MVFQPELTVSFPIKKYNNADSPVMKTVAEIKQYGIDNNLGDSFMLVDVARAYKGFCVRYFYADTSQTDLYFGTGTYLQTTEPDRQLGFSKANFLRQASATAWICSSSGALGYSTNTSVNFQETVINDIRYMYSGGNTSGDATYRNQVIYLNGEYNIYIDGSPVVQYIWKSVSAISGNKGQYFCNLAQIADDKIGDINTVIATQDRTYFTALPSQSDLFYIISNLTNNEWHTIGYCGDNEIQAYKSYIAAQVPSNDAYSLQLRLMMAAGNTYPITTPQNISIYLNRKYTAYLCFVEDAENEVAMLDYIIEYDGSSWQYNNLTGYSDSVLQGIYTWLHPDGEDNPDESDDPYDAGSTDLGGEGGLPTPQDSLHLSTAPTKGGLELGFITAYVPTPTQLTEIADFLWSDDVLDNFKKYFNNFADNIISLYMLPYEPSSMPSKKFKVGKMESEDIGNVSYITQRVVDIDMGEFIISPKWTSYLDYAPYTKFDVFLPFLGIHSLDTDEIMSPANMDGYLSDKQGCTLSLTYRLDLLTGNIVAYLKINGEIRYQFSGKCGWQIPITGQSFSSMIQSIITAGAGLASTIAAGGLTAPLKGLAKGAGVEAAISGTVAAQKPNVYRAGSLSGDISMLGYDTPYLIRTMPSKAECKNLKSFIGYPSYKTGKLSEFSGFTVCIDAHVETISCTEEERSKILAYLKEGVII